MTENHWKLTAIGLMLVIVTALVTGLVVANWSGSQADRQAAMGTTQSPTAAGSSPAAPSPAATNAPPVADVSSAPRPSVAAAPQAARTAGQQRVSGLPTKANIDACNHYAAAQVGQRDKAAEIVKDGAIGAIAGAAIGAAGGAIADGGKGAGKGAAIGGLVGAGGGSLYGLNENHKRDQAYRDAYARCMHDHGYRG